MHDNFFMVDGQPVLSVEMLIQSRPRPHTLVGELIENMISVSLFLLIGATLIGSSSCNKSSLRHLQDSDLSPPPAPVNNIPPTCPPNEASTLPPAPVLTPSPTSLPTDDEYDLVGCYSDDPSDRLLSGNDFKMDSSMTTEVRVPRQSHYQKCLLHHLYMRYIEYTQVRPSILTGNILDI